MRDHGFHRVRVTRVVAETADASSFVLDAPFVYEAGQFCTFRVVIDGVTQLRSYSMSSAPGVDDEFQVTVKRVPGGPVSNWLLDNVQAGTEVELTYPAGVFRLTAGHADLVAFAGGSGITPVHSLLKSALADTSRGVRLLYANRDADSTIFAAELAALEAKFGERLAVTHRYDAEHGFVDAEAVTAFVGADNGADFYICGPGPYMDIVEGALLALGAPAERIHVERFTPAAPEPAAAIETDPAAAQVTVELGGKRATGAHHRGTTLLQMARQLGMSPPYSCESGSCATCMARLVDGTVKMQVNNALTDDEVTEGWVLTCQSVPTSATVHVIYED
ncbi:MAG TPA: ferredoxin--NADP reductase [Acidimicrobiales bacterium]|nr:ferredoxin--NADP reductase [Acidimicrobiales bacterium]